MYNTIDEAVEVARHNIPVQKEIVKEEYWSRYVIVEKGGRYRVLKEDSLTPPDAPGLLAWSDPLKHGGEVIAHVDLDGTVRSSVS